jgi:hypothetical protein
MKPWEDKYGRDLRVDFFRGIVMFILIVIHIEIFSIYNFIAWERVGLISGGEGFVILSGFVIGMVYRSKISKNGWKDSILALFDRAFQLYKVNIFIILSIFLLSKTNIFDFKYVMTFIDHANHEVYNLYPSNIDDIMFFIYQVLTLKVGPHQTQILGLYVFLLIFSPIALFFYHHNRWKMFIIISWIIYFINYAHGHNLKITGCQFENGFPLLTWQVIYFNGMCFGYYKKELSNFFEKNQKYILSIVIPVFFIFFFIAQNTTNPLIPSFLKIGIIPQETFNLMYKKYFLKNTLGFFRIVNYFFALVFGFWFLSKFWNKIYKYFGWYFIPIGQNSLYVFIIHVYIVMLVSNFIPFGFDNINYLNNTLAHTLALFSVWLMVRNKMLFAWIPR